jgi:chromosomal replication initiator protein
MELSAADVWSRILGEARAALPEQAFRTWLAPTEAVAISHELLIVSTPNPFAVAWVEDKYAELLMAIAERQFGRRFTLSVQHHGAGGGARATAAPAEMPSLPLGEPLTAPPAVSSPAHASSTAPAAMSAVGAPTAANGVRSSSPLNERYTFDRFVVGNSNQFASAAAHAVAEAPAKLYNPLFIYGGVGLGKTHLMHAIGHALLEKDPTRRVVYLSSERFTNDLVTAIQEGTMAEFRRLYRQIDLLLVDDIQFLEGKERTQEEFFHTFNALHDAQRQIVLTSDRPPKEIGLEDRLVSRFEWGLVTDIKAPDEATRMAILRKKIEEDGLEIADQDRVLEFVADRCRSSVRELEGAVIKLLAYASLTRREITLELAHEVLGGGAGARAGGSGSAEATPELVRRRVAEAWGITVEALQSKRRTKDVTAARQVAMFLIKERFDLALVEIGRMFGGRDHSTVIHSINKVRDEIESDAAFGERVNELRSALG